MSTDHSSSVPPFDMGSNSIDINTPPVSVSDGIPPGQTIDVSPNGLGQTQSNDTTSIPGPKVDAIEFRVIRPGVPVRRLRLTGNRYTFGSAEGCSIRLNDATLRPMHAVLIRDANRVLVRAYSVPLEINGNRMTETSLQIGDVLRMGAYRFELLSGIDPSAKLASAIDPMTSAVDSAEPMDQQKWHSRLQREAAQWRLRQSEVDLRENRCIERETELRVRESEMWSRADQLHRRETQLMSQETAALQIQEEYLARKEELAKLRDESSSQRRLLDDRQDQIRSMESEYQQQVDNATRQLELSQQQAESATEAVQRMRDQFASLNEQLERLTQQQDALESNDQSHVEQHRQLQQELESARDEAIDARAQSEARRQDAENRVEELNAEIESMRSADSEQSELADQLTAKLTSDHDSMVDELRGQIDELEDRVRQATEEASSLREDYEGACASIRQLELLVDQTSAERDEARSGLEIESDALRQSVEQLTHDLGCANVELGELRAANESLGGELTEVKQERDQALEEAEARPTSEAFEALSSELDTVKTRLEQMQRDYDETIARVDSYNQDSSASPLVDDVEPESYDDSATSQKLGLLGEVDEDASVIEATDSSESIADMQADCHDEQGAISTQDVSAGDEVEESAEEDDDEAWPTYQTPSDTQEFDAAPEPVNEVVTATNPWETSDEPAEVDPDSVDPSSSDNAEASAEAGAEDSFVESQHGLETQAVENQWRPDAEESPEAAGHLNAWDEPASETESEFTQQGMEETPVEAMGESSDEADQPLWQTESPEVAVDEAIADIEHSVDQAIADIERSADSTLAEAEIASDSEAVVDETTVDDSANGLMAAGLAGIGLNGDASNQEEEDHTAFNPWAETPAEEEAVAESETTDDAAISSPYQNMWQSEDESTEHPVDESLSQESIDPAEDEAGGYQPIDPWSQLTPQADSDADASESYSQPMDEEYSSDSDLHSRESEDEETSEGSLADMLIRDMDEERAEEQADLSIESADFSNQYAESSLPDEGSVQDSVEDSGEDSVESTFVMDSASPNVEDYEAEQSAWDLQRPDQDQGTGETAADGQAEVGYESSEAITGDDVASDPESATESGVDEDDDSIEAYMNRLLKRVQTGPEEDGELENETQSITMSGNTVDMKSTDADPTTNVEVEPVDNDAPLVPRSQAPERSRNMSAMRDLANQSARSAVARSVRVQARDTQVKAFYQFLGALVGICCGLMCLYFRDALGTTISLFFCGFGVVVAAVYAHAGMGLMNEANARIKAAEAGEDPDAEDATDSSDAAANADTMATEIDESISMDATDGERGGEEVLGETSGDEAKR